MFLNSENDGTKTYRIGRALSLILAMPASALGAVLVASPVGVRHGYIEYHVSCGKEIECDGNALSMCKKGHRITVWRSPTDFDFVCDGDKLPKQRPIQIFIKPNCKTMFYGPDFIDADGKARKTRKKPDYWPWDPSNAVPMVFKDPRTSIAFYVESDGRHVSAIDGQGQLLWVRDPFEDSRFCAYRTPRQWSTYSK